MSTETVIRAPRFSMSFFTDARSGDRERVVEALLAETEDAGAHDLRLRRQVEEHLGLRAPQDERANERAQLLSDHAARLVRDRPLEALLEVAAVPSMPGFTNLMIAQSSERRFSTGVPESASRISATSWRAARAVAVVVFFTFCASSRTTQRKRMRARRSTSRRRRRTS